MLNKQILINYCFKIKKPKNDVCFPQCFQSDNNAYSLLLLADKDPSNKFC